MSTPPSALSRAELARYVDHTLLAPHATREQVRAGIREASELGVYSVCVSPSMLPVAAPAHIKVVTVCGFPSGTHHLEVKAGEALRSARDGADEIDMVINISRLIEGDDAATQDEIAAVRAAVPPPVVLKVIIESAALTDEQIVRACEAAKRADADFVKTSTGFHRSGGASVQAVALMAATVGDRLGVKASGGIRTTTAALAMIEAGATRLGLSSSAAVLGGLS